MFLLEVNEISLKHLFLHSILTMLSRLVTNSIRELCVQVRGEAGVAAGLHLCTPTLPQRGGGEDFLPTQGLSQTLNPLRIPLLYEGVLWSK